MYKILNKFLGTKYFDTLPRFITRKIFKIFKIFFVETNLKIPKSNHPNKIDKKNQTEIIKNNNNLYKPFSTCSTYLNYSRSAIY